METDLESTQTTDGTAAAAAEKRDLLARLLGRVAHEIRNPLSSLDVHFQLLEEDLAGIAPGLRETLATRLGVIRGELHRLDRIVTQFLRLAGPSALELEPVAVGGVVRHVCQLLGAEAASRGIELTWVEAGGLPTVAADPVRLTQVLVNLVINAIQAVDRDGRIEVLAQVIAGQLALEVKDSGPGIPEERLAAIFDPYYTTKEEGHGLGLWIAHQIVSAHGGTLLARNRAGGGAAFVVLLPLGEGAPGAAEGPGSQQPS